MISIPGTTKISRLEENVKGADFRLSQEDLKEIEKAFLDIDVKGARYPQHLQQLVGR